MEKRRIVLKAAGYIIVSMTLSRPVFAGPEERFYTQIGSDPIFDAVMKSGKLPRGRNSGKGFTGSKVKINHDLFKGSSNAHRPLIQDIKIHTLGSSSIDRKDFAKWSRWYQEDGNTQIFRLFKDEENVRNSRKLAARIEAHSGFSWKKGDGWQEWVATYTIIKPHNCCIFQAKNPINHWSVMLNINDAGDVKINSRRGEDKLLAKGMTGKPFDIRIRENGHNYEVYFNGKKEGEGVFARPKRNTNFRWGMYLGAKPVRHDAMILVTGAAINPTDSGPTSGSRQQSEQSISIRMWTDVRGRTIRAPAKYEPGSADIEFYLRDRWIEYPISRLSKHDQEFLQSGVSR